MIPDLWNPGTKPRAIHEDYGLIICEPLLTIGQKSTRPIPRRDDNRPPLVGREQQRKIRNVI